MLIIDVHAHIYSPDERRYKPKANPLRIPGNKGSVEDLQSVMRANGVRAVRAIQTVSFYGYDNGYLCDRRKSTIVGWPESAPSTQMIRTARAFFSTMFAITTSGRYEAFPLRRAIALTIPECGSSGR